MGARQVFVVKRSMGAGYAGIKNALFELPQTAMVLVMPRPCSRAFALNCVVRASVRTLEPLHANAQHWGPLGPLFHGW